MWKDPQRLWIGATALLTVCLLIIVLPILYAKYGLVTAILLGGILILGMALYYLRGIVLSRTKKR